MMKPEDAKRTAYIGIDPGKSGGLAAVWGGDVSMSPMPETERDIYEWFGWWNQRNRETCVFRCAVIEKVHSMPKQGVASSFTFGQGYGFLRGCLIAAGIPFEEVTPQTWMKALGIPSRKGCGNKRQGKNRLRGFAQQLYPDLAIWSDPKSIGRQLAICDALLIATYCQRKHEGKLNA